MGNNLSEDQQRKQRTIYLATKVASITLVGLAAVFVIVAIVNFSLDPYSFTASGFLGGAIVSSGVAAQLWNHHKRVGLTIRDGRKVGIMGNNLSEDQQRKQRTIYLATKVASITLFGLAAVFGIAGIVNVSLSIQSGPNSVEMPFDQFAHAMEVEEAYAITAFGFFGGMMASLIVAAIVWEYHKRMELILRDGAVGFSEVKNINDFPTHATDKDGSVMYSTELIKVKLRCRACGALNAEEHKFCENCGTPL